MLSPVDSHFTLTAAALSDGLDILEMLRDIGPGENGFTNASHDLGRDAWPVYLANQLRYAQGVDLLAGHVPQTVYWLRRDGYPVGMSKVRHTLNDELRARGGHIGYCVRPSERGRGYGHILLSLTLEQASRLGLDRVLITADWGNTSSRAMIERQGGVLERDDSGNCRYWVPTRGETGR